MTEPDSDSPRPDPFDGPEWGRRPGGTPADGPGHRPGRVRTRRRIDVRKLRRRRYWGGALLLAGGVLLLGAAWIAVTGLIARSQLDDARADVARLRVQVTQGDFTAARATAADLRTHAHRAHWLTSGPAWASADSLTGGGAFATVRTVTAQIDHLASDVLPPLVRVSEQIDPSSLRRPDGSIDLSAVTRAAPVLHTAVLQLSATTAAVRATDAHTQIGAVDHARTQLLTQLGDLRHTLAAADTAARVIPTMLGADGTKRYFVAFQNEAELRGTGGLPGAFAIVRADHGKLTFERFENDGTLIGTQVRTTLDSSYLDPAADYSSAVQQQFLEAFGRGPMQDYRNSNLSPHYPFAAQIWIAMWRQYSGQRLDGAIALDPTALSYLLRITGPTRTAGGQLITARNVVALTQQTAYLRYPKYADQDERKAFLLDVARAVSADVLGSKASTTALVRAGARAADERRLLVYSTDDTIEAQLVRSTLGGAVPVDARPYAGLSIVNLGGNKLDYYLHRSLAWTATGCGASRTVTATTTLRNAAPAGLPVFAYGRVDRKVTGAQVGDNRLLVSYYATSGAQLTGAFLDGKGVAFYQHTLLGRQVYVFDVELPRGATRSLRLTFTEDDHGQQVDVLRQPGVIPLTVAVREPRC